MSFCMTFDETMAISVIFPTISKTQKFTKEIDCLHTKKSQPTINEPAVELQLSVIAEHTDNIRTEEMLNA